MSKEAFVHSVIHSFSYSFIHSVIHAAALLNSVCLELGAIAHLVEALQGTQETLHLILGAAGSGHGGTCSVIASIPEVDRGGIRSSRPSSVT